MANKENKYNILVISGDDTVETVESIYNIESRSNINGAEIKFISPSLALDYDITNEEEIYNSGILSNSQEILSNVKSNLLSSLNLPTDVTLSVKSIRIDNINNITKVYYSLINDNIHIDQSKVVDTILPQDTKDKITTTIILAKDQLPIY